MDAKKRREGEESAGAQGMKSATSYVSTMGSEKMSVVFSISHQPSALVKALTPFQQNSINLTHIESRPLAEDENKYKFLCNLEICNEDDEKRFKKAIGELKEMSGNDCVKVLSRRDIDTQDSEEVPWFPIKIAELDRFASQILSYGSELDSDHPGFTDEIYRKRRKMFADIAFNYKHGEPIPHVEYNEAELATWRTVFTKLSTLFETHACKEFRKVWPLLVQNCNYNKDTIPQLQQVSQFTKDCTGFTLRPVAGLLSSRDFLAGLAFRVFHSTQYIRHGANPFYTPEPDVCHELIGHVPLFCDPEFAAFSQEIGLASLGAPDEWIEKLATLYWFTIEFGVCKEEGALKAYGAGCISSIEELENCISDSSQKLPFEPENICTTKYPITTIQPVYFVAPSFAEAKRKVREFSSQIPRPFTVHYNPYTQSVQLINKRANCVKMIRDLANEMKTLEDAVRKLED
ncbi:phenylalanine-4-hydroxylase-like isoform X3 [Bolinopsis microptera]|uniref:phenylalanine-4-hydroxylase-like isoform X3 n=1 Tax=Bolinopsis microptera TaxID=2820187 RepID=UPI003079D768